MTAPGEDPIDPRSPDETAFEEYLEAAVRGEADDLDAYLAKRGGVAPELRARLAAFREFVASRADARPAAAPSPLPERVGDFRVLRRLGSGGMSVVYLAEQVSLGRHVALKVLRPDRATLPWAHARLRREAQAIARLRHPNVVAVHGAAEEDGVRWLAMELVPGKGLDEHLRESAASGEPIPLARVLRWISGVARGLQAAHDAGIVHRDVKPSNVRITPEDRAVLLDFGLAHDGRLSELTLSGDFRGTPHYASPEQVAARRTEIDARTDVYSLGATLYRCITGRVPFEGETTEQVFSQILLREPEPPRRRDPKIPRDVETVILKAMEKDRAKRYASAAALADDLDALVELRPIGARPAGALERTAKWARRNRAGAGAAGVAAALLVAFAVYLAAQSWTSARERERWLAQATVLGERGDHEGALAAVERAIALAPDDAGAIQRRLDLVRARASARCEAGLDEARRRVRDREQIRASVAPLRARVASARERFESAEMSGEEVDAMRRDEAELAGARRRLEESWVGLLEVLQRAARDDPEHAGLSAASAAAYAEKWREAVEAGDADSQAVYAAKVRELDADGRFRRELEGAGTVAVTGSPADAELFLFRYETCADLVPGGEVRLAPVPFHPSRGILSGSDAPLGPGEPALVVSAVEAGSTGDRAGVRPGDFVRRVAGQPMREPIFVKVVPGGVAEAAGVRTFDRIVRVNGAVVTGLREIDEIDRAESPSGPVEVVVADGAQERTLAGTASKGFLKDLGIVHLSARLMLGVAPGRDGVTIDVVDGSGERRIALDAERPSGITGSVVSAPLRCAEAHRIGLLPSASFEAPPGSYLLVARRPGYTELRVPVVVPRGASVTVDASMLRDGDTPPRCVWIPPGPFEAGGDGEAPRAWPGGKRELPGYWIHVFELPIGLYVKFLNDPETRAEIDAAAAQGKLIRVPRSGEQGVALCPMKDGDYVPAGIADTAVTGISYDDALAYCAWKTREARAHGKACTFDLPTEAEWEKAARGVDGRKFPWGDAFDWRFCCGGLSPTGYSGPGHPGRFLADESPYGVRELAGNVAEWCRSDDPSDPTRPVRGGTWAKREVRAFRAAQRSSAHAESVSMTVGFRYVVRPDR